MQIQNLNESVYQKILEKILSKEYKPGDKITEKGIADEIGASRTPVREALRRLADDGIIEIHPNRKTMVAEWDDEAIRQIGLMRIHLDLLAVKLAVRYGSNDDFDRMFEHSKLCLAAANVDNIAKRIREDCAFHCDLSRISKNAQLHEFSRNLYLKIEFLQSWRGTFLENPEEQHRQHIDIYNALLERDAQRASGLILSHHMHFHDLGEYYCMDWIKCLDGTVPFSTKSSNQE